MPKIPTFKSTARPTAETASVTTDISVSPFRTMAGALRPLGQAAEDYYIRERGIKEKTEATKRYTELSTELDTIQEGASNSFDPQEAADTFGRQSQFLLKEKLSQVKNRRVRDMIQNKFDLDTFQRGIKIKETARDRLDEEFRYNNKIEREQNLSKYRTAKTQQEKEMIRNTLITNVETNGNYLGDKPLTIQKTKDAINKDLFDIDFEKDLESKNLVSAAKKIKDFKNTPFLTDDQRQQYEEKLKNKLKEVELEDAILNGSSFMYSDSDRKKGIDNIATSGKYKLSEITEKAAENNVLPSIHDNVLGQGMANASATGDQTKVSAGLTIYKTYLQQGSSSFINSKLSKDEQAFYATMTFMTDTMKMSLPNAMTAYGKYNEARKDPNYRPMTVNNEAAKKTAKSIGNRFLETDAENKDEIQDLVKRYANIIMKISGGKEADVLKSVEQQISQNFRIDIFNRLVPIKRDRPVYHDESIKAFIKDQYDKGIISNDLHNLEDIIAVDINRTSTTDTSGIQLIDKKTRLPITLFEGPRYDNDGNRIDGSQITDKELRDKVYPLAFDERYQNYLARFNQRREAILNMGLLIQAP